MPSVMDPGATETAAEAPDTVSALPISTRTIFERDGTVQRTLLVFCPMDDETVPIDRCMACPMCTRFDATGPGGRPSVACSFHGATPSSPARKVGQVVARFAMCVRVDAVPAALSSVPPDRSLALVDEQGRFAGVLEPGPHVRIDDGGHRQAVEEHESIPAALARMARARMRQVAVVARDGTVLGALDDLDALRALRDLKPE